MQGFSWDRVWWHKSDLTSCGGPRMVNNIVQVTVATTSSLKADLFNMADKHADIRRSVWTTPSVSDN